MPQITPVRDFCPLKIKFTQFPNGFRLKLFVNFQFISSVKLS